MALVKECFFKGMPYCFAFGCNSGGRTKVAVPVRFFKPPKDPKVFEVWKLKIPRKDKALTATDAVCKKHFSEEDILKTKTVVKNQQEIVVQRKHWALKEGAYPTIFEGIILFIC